MESKCIPRINFPEIILVEILFLGMFDKSVWLLI